MIGVIRNTSDSKKALQAEYSAQSGVELANLILASRQVGESADLPSPSSLRDFYLSTGSTCDVSSNAICVNYTVFGKDTSPVYTGGNYRSIPLRGTGNAGTNCNVTGASDQNDACNWNKIYYGESIEIPLYLVTDPTSNPPTVQNFSGLDISDFKIKVRTPCKDGTTTCVSTGRYTIEKTPTTTLLNGDVVMNWQITGDCTNGICTLIPILDQNGSIQQVSINNAINSSFTVTDFSTNSGQDNATPPNAPGIIINFLKNASPPAAWSSNSLQKAKLKISYIKEAVDDDSNNPIPYLEYQILYGNDALAAVYKVTINGYAQGFKFSLNGVQSLNSGMFDFAVQN